MQNFQNFLDIEYIERRLYIIMIFKDFIRNLQFGRNLRLKLEIHFLFISYFLL